MRRHRLSELAEAATLRPFVVLTLQDLSQLFR
jgi:hypothetical protein